MQSSRKICSYIQAGGASKRFGSDKAEAMLEGEPMLKRMAGLVARVCGSVKIVGSGERYGSFGFPVVEDGWPGEGPLGGILTALRETQRESKEATTWSLIVSCDMPFLTHEWLDFLSEHALKSDAQVVAAEAGKRLEPLCACWRSDGMSQVQEAFDSGVRRVSEGMRRLRMEVLDESVWKRFDTEGRLFWNMNTPEDYAEAKRILETGKR